MDKYSCSDNPAYNDFFSFIAHDEYLIPLTAARLQNEETVHALPGCTSSTFVLPKRFLLQVTSIWRFTLNC